MRTNCTYSACALPGQAKVSYENLREQIAEVQDEYRRVVPESGGFKQVCVHVHCVQSAWCRSRPPSPPPHKQVAGDAGERLGREFADTAALKLDLVLNAAAERFGLDPAVLGAPLVAQQC